MLKLIALAACTIGFVFLGPKALAEFRQVLPGARKSSGDTGGGTDSGKKPESGIAA
jgi:hypothetical protein